MKAELELALAEKYPKILRDYGGDVKTTCMGWGIECDDGWYNILDECMNKIQFFCDLCFYKTGMEVQVIATQIKEKFGTLCFYNTMINADEIESNILHDIIQQTEDRSAHTCEITGEYGTMCRKNGYWYKTLCYEQARKHDYVACSEDTEKYWQEKDTAPKNNDPAST